MNTLSPDFAQYWLAGQSSSLDVIAADGRIDEPPSPSQQEALDELAGRINAARSVY